MRENERLQEDLTRQEIAASEQTAFISDLTDVDRTPELLLWVIQSFWRSDGEAKPEKSAAPSTDSNISIISIIDRNSTLR